MTASEDVLLDPEEMGFLLRLARATLVKEIGHDPSPLVEGIESDPAVTRRLREPRGVFVTLRELRAGKDPGESLRGCIGILEAKLPLFRAVMLYARHAALDDPRFAAVTADELGALRIEVSALTPLSPIADPSLFRPGKDGILLRLEGRHAVFLPQVAAEQGWGREETFRHLCLKAGADPEAWRGPGARFLTFQAQVFAEGEPGMPPAAGPPVS